MTDQKHTPTNSAREASSSPNGTAGSPSRSRGRRIMRWLIIALATLIFGFLMREVLYPFRDQPYMEIGHGSHTHYVPKDRNETVPVSSFPMRPPGPDERITPDGDIVSKE